MPKDLTIVDYPKYFTPNGDGYHDTWNITTLKNQPDTKIFIFDRFGKLLKEISSTGTGWDGTFNGKPMIADDYWFLVKYSEQGITKEFKAHFAIKR
ncbi:T9SS type B sorting domain-containing protein [Flavobacterium sp. 3HN19-14]|uniref:T9SS type B sorting domain-containing protein n=1 Tax=Flavobacterium sp. 3HN19-14 TaxID=3448133 RepID=UPI003EE3ABF8